MQLGTDQPRREESNPLAPLIVYSNMNEIEIIAKLKKMSNLDYCQSAEDCQYALEEINDLLNREFPDIEEEGEDDE